ncbi:fibronectin type III domain-containing protein [Kribbella deserti]|uniref:Fibronectin type III domain-containing protein n=1 Tax=Kribbella deserti TaxID=1926257 RepID=A0ABV6QEV6_9ACTN
MRRGFRLLSLPLLLSLLIPASTYSATAVPVTAAATTAAAAPAVVQPASAGAGQYVPLPAAGRFLDTGATNLVGQEPVVSTFTGRGGIPATGVAALAVNIVVLNATAKGGLVSWPTDQAQPTTVSGVMFSAGDTYASGSSILRLSPTGQASFRNISGGTVRIIVDVAGYYTSNDNPTATASRYVPLKQARILDTTKKIGVPTDSAVPGRTATVPFAAAGVGGLPAAASITSVVVTLTAMSPTAIGGMIVYPSGAARPGVSHGNWIKDRSKSNTITTRIGADGKLILYNAASVPVDFRADVVGYYTASTNSAVASTRITTLPVAARVLDTGATLVAAGKSHTFKVSGAGGLPTADLAAVSLTLITAGSATSGDIVTSPAGEAAPATTDVIAVPGGYSFNQVIVRPNVAGEVTISNLSTAGLRFYADVQAYALKPKAPAAPTSVVAVPGDKSINLSWSPPEDTGDLTLKGYEVTRSPGGQITNVITTSTAITGLSNDETYTFKVVAINAVGRSTAEVSAPVSPAPPTPPTQPFITELTPRDSAVTAYWAAPTGMTDSIAGYTLTATPGGATVTVPGSAREAVLTGLSNGTTYAIRLTATNANGSGVSDPRPATPVAAKVPLAPPINAVTSLNGRVDVQWVRPADGGANIDGYQVTAEPGGITQTIPADTTVTALTGLTNGQKYTITVRAHNKAGYGDTATTSSTPLAARAPGIPDDVHAAPSANGSVQVGWKAPIDVGTSPVTGYRVTVTPGGRTVDVSTSAATITGLDPALGYQFAISAKNAAGTGTATVPTVAVKPVLAEKVAPVVLTAESQAKIISVNSTAVVAASPTAQLSGLQVGQTVVAGAGPTTPEGLLRRITRTQVVNGVLVLSVVEASLSEVYDAMSLATQFKTTADEVATFVPAETGIKLRSATAGGKTHKQGGFRTVKTAGGKEAKVYLKDGAIVVEYEKEFQRGSRLTVTGSIAPKFEGWMLAAIPNFRSDFKMTADMTVSMRADLAIGKKREHRQRLGSLVGTCVNVPLGRVPVTVCPKVQMDLVLSADGRAGLAFEGTLSRRLGATLKSDGDQVVSTGINEAIPDKPSVGGIAHLFGNATASVGLSPAMVLAVYGQGGPVFELSPYLEAETDTAADPARKISIGIAIGAGLTLDFVKKNVVRWVKPDIVKLEWPFWDSGGPFLGVVIDPGSAELSVGQSQQFDAQLSGHADEPAKWRIVSGPGTISANGLYEATADGLTEIEAVIPPGIDHGELKNTAKIDVAARPPSAPRNVTVTPGTRSAFITWDTPENSGGNPITKYHVSTVPDSGGSIVLASDGNRETLGNLTPGVSYVVNVQAISLDGGGEAGSSKPFTPMETTLANPGGSNIVEGVPGTDVGLEGAVLSDSGRYAFFAAKQSDGRYYLIRRDLADGSYQTVSRGSDGVTPEPISVVSNNQLSFSAYSTAGEGRYIAYRIPYGTIGDSNRIIVRDLETNTRWTTSQGYGLVTAFRLSADGTKVASITGTDFGKDRKVWWASKERGYAELLMHCFDSQSCGLGSEWTLGMTPDGNTVMYEVDTANLNSPYWGAINKIVFHNVQTGEKPMPYLRQGLQLAAPVMSADGTWIAARGLLPPDYREVGVARRIGTGPLTAADVFVRSANYVRGISNDGNRIAWTQIDDVNWRYNRLVVYTRSSRTNWVAPGPPSTTSYSDARIHLAPSGTAVTWRPSAGVNMDKPQGAVLR